MSIRMLIAEGHAMVREGLRYAFQDTEIDIVGEATTGDEVIQLAMEDSYDLILLEIRLPGKDGFEVLERLMVERPNLPTVVYSHSDRSDYRERAKQLNARAYVLKSAERHELIDKLLRVSHGERLWDHANADGRIRY